MRDSGGFSLIEGLIATAVVATVAVGTSTLGTTLWKQSRRSRTINAATYLQGQVMRALTSKESFEPGTGTSARDLQLIQMAAGTAPSSLDLFITDQDGRRRKLATVGQRTDMNDDGTICTAGRACPLYVDLGLRCTPDDGCSVAYRVGIRDIEGLVTPPPLGAQAAPPGAPNPAQTFATSDYSVRLSYDFLEMGSKSTSCQGNDILVTGVNKKNGSVTCVQRSLASGDLCPDFQIGQTVVAKDGRLVMGCRQLARVKCPDDYVLQTFDFAQLDRGPAATPLNVDMPSGLQGQCVYRWRNDVPFTWPSAYTSTGNTVTAQVCNADVYDATAAACTYEVEPGSDRAGSCGAHSTVSAVLTTAPTRANRNQVGCRIVVNDQCGSRISVRSKATGRCLVQERTRTPSLKKAPLGGDPL